MERISCWMFGESMVPVGLFGLLRTIIFVFGFMRAFKALMSRRSAASAAVADCLSLGSLVGSNFNFQSETCVPVIAWGMSRSCV